jgi:hypothetical protein
MRWRYGDTYPVVAAVDAKTLIEIGDLLYQDIDDAKPASDLSVPQSVGRQEQFAKTFLGVSLQRSPCGDTTTSRVATTGVFEFECPCNTFELGDLVGTDGTGNGLLNQQVVLVKDSRYAIGRVAKREKLPTLSVLVAIRSTIMTGGIQGNR